MILEVALQISRFVGQVLGPTFQWRRPGNVTKFGQEGLNNQEEPAEAVQKITERYRNTFTFMSCALHAHWVKEG